jgi:Domain of unknown function (DUF5063)
VVSAQTDVFFNVAQTFCSLVEEAAELSTEDFSTEDFAHRATVLLANLVALGTELPHMAADDAELETPEVKRPSFGGIGNFDYYSAVLDPFELPDAAIGCGSLADDFQDIYMDLKHSLLLRSKSENEAVFHVKLMYGHWVAHALGALRALHEINTRRAPEAGYRLSGQENPLRSEFS